MLFLIHDHFIKTKMEYRKTPFFGYKKSKIISEYPICFFDQWPSSCGWFHCYFLTHGHFMKQKTEKRKIPFLVTKRGQKSYQICFFDLRPRHCGWFHLLFSTHNHFIKPKTEKRKIPFLVTKSNQKFNLTNFSNCWLFHIFLWFKIILKLK